MTVVPGPDTTVLELVEYYPETEIVFNQYDRRHGGCICCECLFCSMQEVARRYEINLEELLSRLSAVMDNES